MRRKIIMPYLCKKDNKKNLIKSLPLIPPPTVDGTKPTADDLRELINSILKNNKERKAKDEKARDGQ